MTSFGTGFYLLSKSLLFSVPHLLLRRKLCGGAGVRTYVLKSLDTSERYAQCVQACNDIRSLRKIHAHIFTQGHGNNIYLGSKMLTSYAFFGRLSESKWIFRSIINRNISLWSSTIIGYFRAGYFEEVLNLYFSMKIESIGFDSTTITFGLKSCTELGSRELGLGVHADSFKFGLYDDRYVGSSLVGLYFCFGDVKDAEQAFEEILIKDVAAYTAMVTGYAQLPGLDAWKAFEVATSLNSEGLEANRITLVSFLQAAAQLGALKEGRSVHCYSLRNGIGLSDEVFQTSLVGMYARCGACTSASSAINQVGQRTVASWNALISGFNHSGHCSEAVKCFLVMLQENLTPDSVTLANVLSACFNLNYPHYTLCIHAYLIRKGIPLDTVLVTAIVQLYSECNLMKRARQLFNYMINRDIILYNVMISSYLQHGQVNEAIKILAAMLEDGIRPNPATISILLTAFSDTSDEKRGIWTHGLAVKYGLQSNIDISNQILHMYSKCGRTAAAKTIFNLLEEKNLISWTAMMMGYVNSGHADEVIRLFQEMLVSGQKLDSLSTVTLLQAYAQLGCLEPVKRVHGFIYRMCLEEDTGAMNSLLMSYAKCGRVDAAESVFKSLSGRELASWNTMIAAYGFHGYCKEALELFYQMRSKNLMPNELTFSSVLSACSHAGLLDEGWRVFNSMLPEYSVVPQEEHYCCMVDLLSRAGQLEEAYNFVTHSPFTDKTSAMCSLLTACKVHKNMKLAEIVSKELLYLNSQNSGTYTLVSNVYAQDAKWSKVSYLRNRAREEGLNKMPGYSLVESC